MGYTRCPAYLLNTSNSFCSTSRLRFSRSVGGENRGEIFDGDCPLSHNNGCDFALILWLCLHELPPISKIFDSRKGRHLLQCRPLACPYIGTKCPKLHGDYVGNASRPFPAPVLPSHIPPEKQSKWRRQAHIFLKNLLLLTGTFLDDFRTGRREFFKILFISASLPSRGRRA